jgi:UDP-N-acetylmuramyl pentapeptide phosphotransferase/UDP-N-acetylglucosamine-1-phosphate transferase
MLEGAAGRLVILGPVAAIAFLVTWQLIVLLRPWFARHALARPNARSSHKEPTPQGGGGPVIVATLAATWGAMALAPDALREQALPLAAVTAAALLLAVLGVIDDLRALPEAPRLAMQAVAVGMVIGLLPSDLRILPQLPWLIERACLFVGWLWLVNLVNFMDGIDWMTVAEFVPVTGTLVVFGLAGAVELAPAVLAAALLGAILGFAPFNRPVARLFLGDAGSLPLGLLLGWMLLDLAGKGYVVSAFILPLYYLADATITLGRRIIRGEPFWQAHRSHFYQRAVGNGMSVSDVATHVFAVNVALAGIAVLVAAIPSLAAIGLAAAVALVGFCLRKFWRGKPSAQSL